MKSRIKIHINYQPVLIIIGRIHIKRIPEQRQTLQSTLDETKKHNIQKSTVAWYLVTLYKHPSFRISIHQYKPCRDVVRLSVANGLLDLGVDLDHLAVEFGVVADHDLGVPAGGDEDGVDTGGDGRGEDEGDLEADEEGESDDDGSEATVLVVVGLGDEEVDVAGKSACVSDEHRTERQNGPNEAFLEQG